MRFLGQRVEPSLKAMGSLAVRKAQVMRSLTHL